VGCTRTVDAAKERSALGQSFMGEVDSTYRYGCPVHLFTAIRKEHATAYTVCHLHCVVNSYHTYMPPLSSLNVYD